ncbi:unnamed protein product [Hymenolepis diminuta]|uniref:CNNM transmembrane domain-containing protein n=1 Tax=Hymenolepis diminuta TaxID=6216 RepID=A0A0R3S8W1_HYMDI|nr:unnamed protein product [Hymenolepis diminuta]VUZ57589.1 unnamed protein product [Hymenolepis diminuta]
MGFLSLKGWCFRRRLTGEKRHVLVSEELQRRISYFSMSCVVLIFINILIGLFSILLSLKAHRLLNSETGRIQIDKSGSWLVSESRFLKAKRLGVAACVLNCIGIVSTMCGIVLLLMYFGTEPQQRTSLLDVITSFIQLKSAYHPALTRSATPPPT